MGYRVELPTFEGPLDLLLHLIEEHELDIRDIPIAFIAKKYVEYLTLMQELNIDVASEYLVMAATLTHIKSKSLLPTPPADQEDEDEVELDPRAELIRRLLEYQKYKHAAERLAEHDVLGRDVFPRGMPAPNVDGPAPLTGLSLFKLLDAFQTVLSRAKVTIEHQIDFERFSITDRINELVDVLRGKARVSFEELFQGERTRIDLIVTFLAVLEMTRLRLIRLYQEGPLEMIFIELAVTDEELDERARGEDWQVSADEGKPSTREAAHARTEEGEAEAEFDSDFPEDRAQSARAAAEAAQLAGELADEELRLELEAQLADDTPEEPTETFELDDELDDDEQPELRPASKPHPRSEAEVEAELETEAENADVRDENSSETER